MAEQRVVMCIQWHKPTTRALMVDHSKAHIVMAELPRRTECGIDLEDKEGVSIWHRDLERHKKSVNACKACLNRKKFKGGA
jgi:hypothetical protein